MRKMLPVLLVALMGLASCSKNAELEAPDPFLGHWVSSEAHVNTERAMPGGPFTNYDTFTGIYTADVTPTAFATSQASTAGYNLVQHTHTYTRSGQTLTLAPNPDQSEHYVRYLTANSWTYERVDYFPTGLTRVFITYHR
jgi:hypothetical protein